LSQLSQLAHPLWYKPEPIITDIQLDQLAQLGECLPGEPLEQVALKEKPREATSGFLKGGGQAGEFVKGEVQDLEIWQICKELVWNFLDVIFRKVNFLNTLKLRQQKLSRYFIEILIRVIYLSFDCNHLE